MDKLKNYANYIAPNEGNFEPVVDEQKKTITINAVYYTAEENKEYLQKAIDAWNAKSGEYHYIDDTQTYDIIFNLSIDNESFTDSDAAAKAYRTNIKSRQANYYQVNNPGKHPVTSIPVLGKTENGNIITVKNSADVRTIMHEIGHTLGLKEWSTGLMESGGKEITISQKNITAILRITGIGNPTDNKQYPHYELPINPNSENHIGKPSRIYKMNTGRVTKK